MHDPRVSPRLCPPRCSAPSVERRKGASLVLFVRVARYRVSRTNRQGTRTCRSPRCSWRQRRGRRLARGRLLRPLIVLFADMYRCSCDCAIARLRERITHVYPAHFACRGEWLDRRYFGRKRGGDEASTGGIRCGMNAPAECERSATARDHEVPEQGHRHGCSLRRGANPRRENEACRAPRFASHREARWWCARRDEQAAWIAGGSAKSTNPLLARDRLPPCVPIPNGSG